MSFIASIIDIMAQKSILTLLAGLLIGILFVFSQTAEASKGPIVTNKVSPQSRSREELAPPLLIAPLYDL